MKKYKLIKEYPGSPKLGSINGQNMKTLSLSIVENQPEFWKEIVEKDYEILSILIRRSDKHHKINVDIDSSDDYITSLINCDGNSIYSIKRLSDGEIFTIGDNIQHKISENIFKITSIEQSITSNSLLSFNGNYCRLDNAIKIKQPLFTTEDGINIFEGDNFCEVTNNFSLGTNVKTKIYQSSKIFSTKEKAEEYILINKPCLSLKDLLQFFPDTYIPFKKGQSATEDVNTQQLEDLVKQKLK